MHRNSKILLVTFPTLLLGSLAYLAFKGTKKNQATPKNSKRIKNSKYAAYADWLEAMARHETASYSSQLATKYNNIFGMGDAQLRPEVSMGATPVKVEGQYMHVYKDYDQSIEDLLLWMDYTRFPQDLGTLTEFVKNLKVRLYFTDSPFNYERGLNRHLV